MDRGWGLHCLHLGFPPGPAAALAQLPNSAEDPPDRVLQGLMLQALLTLRRHPSLQLVPALTVSDLGEMAPRSRPTPREGLVARR